MLLEKRTTDLRINRSMISIGLSNHLRPQNLSIQDCIEDGLIAYHAGTIEKHMGYAFLNFWTSAERFCLKDNHLTERKVMERLLSPLLNKTGITNGELERLYRIRNKMIHEADYGLATEYDRNIMQFYIEPFIAFFIQKLSKYPKE